MANVISGGSYRNTFSDARPYAVNIDRKLKMILI